MSALEDAQCFDCGHNHKVPVPGVNLECGFHNVGHGVCACRSKYRHPMMCRGCGHALVDHQPLGIQSKWQCRHKRDVRAEDNRGIIRISKWGCNCDMTQQEVKINSVETKS